MSALGLESASLRENRLWMGCPDLAINFPERVDAVVLNTAWGIGWIRRTKRV